MIVRKVLTIDDAHLVPAEDLRRVMAQLGFRTVDDMVGRVDCLVRCPVLCPVSCLRHRLRRRHRPRRRQKAPRRWRGFARVAAMNIAIGKPATDSTPAPTQQQPASTPVEHNHSGMQMGMSSGMKH